MNLLEGLRAAATHVTRLVAVDTRGQQIGWIPTQAGRHGFESGARISRPPDKCGPGYAEFLYDDTVTAVHEDPAGVDVTFEPAKSRRFDVIVGADGLHSRVRRILFGPEEQYRTHLGMYIATTDLGRPAADLHSVLIHNAPGRAVAIHPSTGREGAAFIFRHPL